MNTIELLVTIDREGLRLGLDDGGGLRCYGDRAKVQALLPAIRQHKPELLAALAGKPATTEPDPPARELLTTDEFGAIAQASERLDRLVDLLGMNERRALETRGAEPQSDGAENEANTGESTWKPIRPLISAAVDAVEPGFHGNGNLAPEGRLTALNAARIRERVQARMVLHYGEWMSRQTWEARQAETTSQ